MKTKLRRYIVSNLIAMTGLSCYLLADTFFISVAQGANGITALNLALPVYGLMFAIGSMIGVGSATRYSLSRAVGWGDEDRYFSGSALGALAASVPFVLLGLFATDGVLLLLGADATILAVGRSYLRIALCCAPFFMLNYTCTAFVRNDGAPTIAMAATLTSGLFNILFDYIFMFPMGMGMVGAALATGLSPLVSMGICLVHYLSPKNNVRFVWAVPSLRRLAASCSLGVAAFVGEISGAVTTLVFNFLLLNLGGNVTVAAYGVIANVALVTTALFNGVSQGLQPLASAAHGAANRAEEAWLLRRCLQIAAALAVVLVAVVVLLAEPLVSVFNSEGSAQLAAYAVPGIRLYFLGFLLACFNIVRAGYFGAVGMGRESAVIALSRGVVSIVLFAVLLAALWGVTGVWLAFPVSEGFTLLISARMGRKS